MIVVITGPTCSGKTSLVKQLETQGFKQVVTTTTRLPRRGDSLSAYEFVSPDAFQNALRAHKFLEHNQHGDHFYGVKIRSIVQALDDGSNHVMVLDPNGHRKIKRYLTANKVKMLSVYVNADSKIRLQRLVEREQDIDRVVERFAVMVSTEAHWFRDESENYDMILESDEHPVTDLAGVIIRHVNECERNSLSKKVI